MEIHQLESGSQEAFGHFLHSPAVATAGVSFLERGGKIRLGDQQVFTRLVEISMISEIDLVQVVPAGPRHAVELGKRGIEIEDVLEHGVGPDEIAMAVRQG